MLNKLLLCGLMVFLGNFAYSQDQEEGEQAEQTPEVTAEELEQAESEDEESGLKDLANDDTVGEVSLDDFIPSEEISADNSISFPIDI